jgi:hypothetical protein
MAERLIQVWLEDGRPGVILAEGDDAWLLEGAARIYDLAQAAIAGGSSLLETARARRGQAADLVSADHQGRLLAPIDHDDPAHLHVTGTGLTHLGSARGRDAMHQSSKAEGLTDSMRMFLMGVEGGKPAPGETGVQPEWFYKGDGATLVGTGAALTAPAFALDSGEEPEIAGVYLIDPEGQPRRLGFALGNEFSDHVTERHNYLWLAHSKLRAAAIGPELLLGDLPADVRGVSRIVRDGAVVWEKPFLTGEANMAHTLANLEHHHFKYGLFRRPGDVHVHFFGTATLSFADGFTAAEGDVFEIAAPPFTLPLRNPLRVAPPQAFEVRAL